MRILEAFGEPFSFGGQEAFAMNVLGHMDRTDMTFDLLTPYYCDNENSAALVRSWGGEVYSLGCDFHPGHLRTAAIKPIEAFLAEHHYDVIHIHSGSNSMLGMYAKLARQAGISRIIVHSHSTGRSDWKHYASKMATAPFLSRCADEYCACSEEAGYWRFPARICRKSLRVITDGIDVDVFRFDGSVRKALREELGVGDDTILIGNVGRFVYQKNQGFLIDILREIIDRNDDPSVSYKLLLVGDGEEKSMLRTRTGILGLQDSVIFTGVRENVSDYYQAMDLLAVPSKYEGFGMVVAEGQAAGLDIVASDKVPDIANITGSVSFLPLDDKKAWIRSLMTRHERHPENADIVAESEYNIKRTVEVVRAMYLGEVDQRNGSKR